MSSHRPATVVSLIEDLLARHERNPQARNLHSSVRDKVFASVDLQDAFDEELATLGRDGGVELIRTGPKTDRRVTGVRLKDPDVLYRWIGRRSSFDSAVLAVAELRSRPDLREEAVSLIDDVARAWGRNVSHLGIGKGDVRTLTNVIDLAIALRLRLVGEPRPEQDFRTFSRQAVGDSKSLERNVRQVVAALHRMYLLAEDEMRLDPEELLANAGLRRIPQPMLLHGDLELDGVRLPRMPYVGIPTDCVASLRLRSTPDYVLTIENFTSFVRHAREIAGRERALILFTSGFPSRPMLTTIELLSAQARAPTFHWGDMDGGGVRIFQHLERRLGTVGVDLRTHLMNVELLRRFGRQPTDEKRSPGDLDGSRVAELAAFIASSGLAHEQEELDPRTPDWRDGRQGPAIVPFATEESDCPPVAR